LDPDFARVVASRWGLLEEVVVVGTLFALEVDLASSVFHRRWLQHWFLCLWKRQLPISSSYLLSLGLILLNNGICTAQDFTRDFTLSIQVLNNLIEVVGPYRIINELDTAFTPTNTFPTGTLNIALNFPGNCLTCIIITLLTNHSKIKHGRFRTVIQLQRLLRYWKVILIL
jgi:hypothetical protein